MTILLENTLTGDPGTAPSSATLAASGDPLTLAVETRAEYDATHTVHTLPVLRVESGYHRGTTTHGTPALTWDLPPAPWAVRWYMRLPTTQDAGHGEDEVRIPLQFGDNTALIAYETTAGNTYARQITDDLAVPPVGPVGSGSAVPVDQMLRWEARCDGTGLEVRVYPGHTTTGARVMVWDGWVPTGTVTWTGYRYRRRTTLYPTGQGWPENPPGETAELQNELIDLGYDLSPWGADDDYGSVTTAAVVDVQETYDLDPVDGIAGPETRATIDLALGRIPPPLYLSHLAVSDGEWIGPAEAPPEPVAPNRLRLGLPI